MLTRFISDNSYDTLNVEYPLDKNMEIKNIQLNVDGNLNHNAIPSLRRAKDIKINNFTLNILSRNDNLHEFLDFKLESDIANNIFYIYNNNNSNIDGNALFWKINEDTIAIETLYDKLNIKNIFSIDFLDEKRCKIYHERYNLKYILAYSLSIGSLKILPLTANNIESYPTEFNYISNDKNIIFYVQNEIGNFALKKSGSNVVMEYASSFSQDNNFYLKGKNDTIPLSNVNNWVSYENTFNKNNLLVSQDRSHFDIKNNHLFTTTINSIVSSLPINVMTLKNQLNQENDQSRGNINLDENETTLKEYEGIFTGGERELGYDKINLGYTVQTTPFTFKSGKTTYFHVPHSVFPYEKLNINSSKLAEAGAVGGSNPLNSDKIWKKLKDYKNTSPFSNPSEENTGQWLCTWLSAGNPETRPVWVDRYYKPSKTTPYVAMSAIATEIVYKNGFDCLDLKDDVSDVKSSLTFESGCYYAYMHLGKLDYESLIVESLSSKIYHASLDVYKNTNFLSIDPIDGEYSFYGKFYGYIDSNIKMEHNDATFSFFLEKSDWNIPTGNLIFGNYINDGFGFYNYNLNTPYILLKDQNDNLSVMNNNLKLIDKLSTENLTLCSIAGISRRNGFENIHIVTNDFRLLEVDLRGTIVDSSSAIGNILNLKSTDKIYSITNDEYYCYVSTSSGIAAIDLNNNNISVVTAKANIGSGSSFNLLVDSNKNIYKVYGKQPILRETDIYYSSSNKINVYSTALSSVSDYITINNTIDCFGITKDMETNIVSKNQFQAYYKNDLILNFTLSAMDTYSLSAIQLSYCEKFEYGKLRKFKNIFCQNESESYVIQLDEAYNENVIKLDKKYDIIQNNLDITNYNHNIQCLSGTYNEKTYHFKVKILNKVNMEDYTELVFIIDSNDLSTGYRQFTFSIDCYNGVASFYLDGQLYDRIVFESKKYTISNTFSKRIFYGSNGYFNGVPAFKYMKDSSDFVCSGFKLKENYIINKAIDRSEAIYFYSKVNPPNDLKYNMPSGKRSFIDSMDKFFNFNIPMFKSNRFKLKIVNSGIIYDDLRKEVESYISEKIGEYIPLYSKLDGFEWIDNTSKPIVLKGDYNVSNSLTNIK